MSCNRRRADFFDMPPAVIGAVEAAVGGPIVKARSATGGFSPGPAGPCWTADGRRFFVKACSNHLSRFAVTAHRREAAVLPLLPAQHPSPALVATVEADDWFVLITEYIGGATPSGRLEPATVGAVLALVATLAEQGSPTPTDLLPAIGSGPGELESRFVWTEMLEHGLPPGLDRWSRRHVEPLAELETDWVDAVAGSSLVHRDLRPDNMVLNRAGGVAVDWPAAAIGAPWVDLVGLLPALAMMGGPRPHEVFEHHPVGATADPAAVNCHLAILTGYFTGQSLKPPIQNVPGIRRFQADQAAVCREWISERLGWDRPTSEASPGPL